MILKNTVNHCETLKPKNQIREKKLEIQNKLGRVLQDEPNSRNYTKPNLKNGQFPSK